MHHVYCSLERCLIASVGRIGYVDPAFVMECRGGSGEAVSKL
jgi:hypothetical protein